MSAAVQEKGPPANFQPIKSWTGPDPKIYKESEITHAKWLKDHYFTKDESYQRYYLIFTARERGNTAFTFVLNSGPKDIDFSLRIDLTAVKYTIFAKIDFSLLDKPAHLPV